MEPQIERRRPRFIAWLRSLPAPLFAAVMTAIAFVFLTAADALLPFGTGIRWRDNAVSSVILTAMVVGSQAIVAWRYGPAALEQTPVHRKAQALAVGSMVLIVAFLLAIKRALDL